MASVSAVISTFERPDACERAVRSALAQEPAPLEVLVCDDGSRDDTPDRFRAWERRDPRVEYVRVEPNRGTPSAARNAGVALARGEWVAFLDDDDEWLPGKLAAQLAHADGADVIGTNAVTPLGELYFAAAPVGRRPSRREILAANPIIQSSAMVRREPLISAGGYPTEPWLRGIEDHAAWLSMSDAGARFLVLGAPLVRYSAPADGQLSTETIRLGVAAARLAWRRVRADPRERARLREALNKTAALARTRRFR
jgi:cellulose synthase/poly-beta-1,6-N-acetylglucosamine synthase-like glycosyltransferase